MRSEMRWIFSVGSEAWNDMESRVIPRNSVEVLGPSVFSTDRGTPMSEKADLRVVRPYAGGEEGGVTMRKSSSRWTTYGSL